MYRKFRFDNLNGINFGVGLGVWPTASIASEGTTSFPALVLHAHFWKWHVAAEAQCWPSKFTPRESADA